MGHNIGFCQTWRFTGKKVVLPKAHSLCASILSVLLNDQKRSSIAKAQVRFSFYVFPIQVIQNELVRRCPSLILNSEWW